MDTRILLNWSLACLMTYVIICTGFVQLDAASAVNGSIIQLKCPYRTSVGKIINWKKKVNGVFEGYAAGTTINTNLPLELTSRLTVTGDHSAGEYNLNISDVRKSDEGTYECSLSGTNSIKSIQLSVITNIPISVSIGNVGLDKKLNGTEGRDLMISCSAVGGDPEPDVKLLISESVVKTAKQSVQYLLSSPNRSYDGQNVKCLAGYEEIQYYPLNDLAKIYLKLKPYPPTFNTDSVNTGEIKPLVISCTATGSRPKASIYWLLGDGKTNITANATQLPISHDATTDTYSVTSTLTYSIDRIYNGKHLICGVSNEATSDNGDVVETSKTLNVTYAPDVTVSSPTYTQDDAIRTVTCNPSGNPDSYTYHKWQHISEYGEIIRTFAGNKTLILPDVPVLFRYQDSGEYVCSASNGIMDKYNKIEQTGSGSVTVNAQPVFTTDTIDKVKQFGEIDKTVDIYVNVYSVPQFIRYKWDQDGKPITQNSAKYVSSSSPTIVKDKIHGEEVQLDGYNVSLTIHGLKTVDLANYTVTLQSGFPDVKFTILLESASVPETPGNFTLGASSATSIIVQWDPHFGGGYKQAFYIQFKVQGSASWTTVSAGKEDINEQRRRRTYEVKNLKKGKAYELRMYAENTAIKRSNFTEVLIAYTQSSEAVLPVAAIIGGIAGGLIAIIIVLLIIVFVQKNRKESGTPSTKLRASSESDEEDGLKDNILYESSQSDGLKKNMLNQSAGPNVESQKTPQTSSEYAVVQKPNAIYAEVNKAAQPKNGKEKKQKDKKEKLKKARKEKAKAVNNNPDDEYANSALQLKNLNNKEYANSTDTQGTSGYNGSMKTNTQGLEYADLTFRQIPTKNYKPVIHGIDERTLYADVDHTKKAPPPPQESEYEETNIKHGKMAQ